MPIRPQPCGCRQAHQTNSGTVPSALGFAPTQDPALPVDLSDWKTLALLALGAILIYSLFFRKSDRQRRAARRRDSANARDRYRRELDRIEGRYA